MGNKLERIGGSTHIFPSRSSRLRGRMVASPISVNLCAFSLLKNLLVTIKQRREDVKGAADATPPTAYSSQPTVRKVRMYSRFPYIPLSDRQHQQREFASSVTVGRRLSAVGLHNRR